MHGFSRIFRWPRITRIFSNFICVHLCKLVAKKRHGVPEKKSGHELHELARINNGFLRNWVALYDGTDFFGMKKNT